MAVRNTKTEQLNIADGTTCLFILGQFLQQSPAGSRLVMEIGRDVGIKLKDEGPRLLIR